MNILYVCGYGGAYSGNFISSLLALDKELRKAGDETCFLLPDSAKEQMWLSKLKKRKIHVFYMKNSFVKEVLFMNQICKRYKIDLIYHHFWCINDAAATRFICMCNKNIKYAIHFHNEYKKSDSVIRERLKRWCLDADLNIGCGKLVADEVKQAGFRNVHSIDNCIDYNRLDRWEKIVFPKGINLLTFSSYSYEVKGVDISIEAVKKCRHKKMEVNLIIVFSSQLDEIRGRVLEQCNGTMPDWIRLMPPREDVASYYHAADAYLNASRSEGLCYASVEAIYCGAQVIQSDIGGNRLDIPESLIFETENIDQLAKKIETFIQQVEDGDNELRAKQKQYILQTYNLHDWVCEVRNSIEAIFDGEQT